MVLFLWQSSSSMSILIKKSIVLSTMKCYGNYVFQKNFNDAPIFKYRLWVNRVLLATLITRMTYTLKVKLVLCYLAFEKTISKLPTLEALRVDPSKILYISSSIYDDFHGESILTTLVNFRKHPEALNVVKYEKYFYALENRKLWLCKQVSKIEKRLKK